jgi:DNA repair ATPase RecN
MTSESIPIGARWLRCDLHVHTPFDGEKQFGEDIRGAIEALKKEKPPRMAEIAERFIDACRSAADGEGIDLVALTDHNSIDGFRYLKPQFDLLSRQARDEGLRMPAILPGCEFSVGGERPIHFLVIFASSTDPDAIDSAIGHVFGTSDRFDPKTGTPRATGQSVDDFLTRLFEYCRPASGDRHLEFVVLPAHADNRKGVLTETDGGFSSRSGDVSVATSLWDEMRGNLRQRVIRRRDWNGFQTTKPFETLPQAFKELLWRWAAARRDEAWDQLTEGQRLRYREQKHWPLVECSDPHAYEAIGTRYTWLKMEEPDVEGIRLSLLDPQSRLRRMDQGPPGQDYPRIEAIRIRSTDFFDDVEVPLSPCLTTFIGGRGTGKSTVVEYLRYGLDRARAQDFSTEEAEIRENVQAMLTAKNERDNGRTLGTLLPDHEIEVDLFVSGHHYRVRKGPMGEEIERDPGTETAEIVPQFDVRTLIHPRVFSQRQIARIAKDPASQRTELDALLDRDELAKVSSRLRKGVERIEEIQRDRARLEGRRRELPAKETELQKVRDQIEFLEKGGGKEVLSRFQEYETERHWLEGTLRELETQARGLDEESSAIKGSLEAWPPPPESGPSKEWIDAVAKRIEDRVTKTVTLLSEEASAFRQLAGSVEEERTTSWLPGYEEARTAYGTLREEMKDRGVDFTQHEKLLQQRVILEREINRLRSIDDELGEVEAALREAGSELVQAHERRLELRRAQTQVLEELDADVRLQVLGFLDRDDFEVRREEWFAGTGLQERDWERLVDYVFASGSVPDRLQELVTALRSDIQMTAERGHTIDEGESRVAALVGEGATSGLTGHFFRALERADRIRLDEMERFLPEDQVEAEVRGGDGTFKPITTGSVGQRSTAILSLVLSAGEQPLIIDQPEDDLDNRYVYDVVVDLLRRRKFSRQIVIATHNANIPVNGDSELIVALHSEGQMGGVQEAGSIDRSGVKDRVSEIMEGSAEAFRLRRERYGF